MSRVISSASMFRFAAVSLAVLAVGLLASCSGRQILVVTDPYWSAAWLQPSGAEKGLRSFAADRGAIVTIETLGYSGNDPSMITGAIAKSQARLVILSPLFSSAADAVARAFPGKRIVRFGGDSGPNPSNLLTLTTQPDKAFRDAGAAAARYAVKAASGLHGSGRVVALFSNDPVGVAETRSFKEGYSGVDGAPPLDILPSRDLQRATLRTVLLDRSTGSVLLYIVAAGELDSYALDLLNGDNAPIITENWPGGATYSGKVIYSVNEDVLGALRKTVETMGRAADNQIGIPWNVRAVGNPVGE